MYVKPLACIFKRKRICSFTIDLNVAIFRNRYANIWHSVHCFTKSYREFIECTAITRTTSIISDKICLLKSFGNIYICQVILSNSQDWSIWAPLVSTVRWYADTILHCFNGRSIITKWVTFIQISMTTKIKVTVIVITFLFSHHK